MPHIHSRPRMSELKFANFMERKAPQSPYFGTQVAEITRDDKEFLKFFVSRDNHLRLVVGNDVLRTRRIDPA